MNCINIKEHFTEYLQNDLSEQEKIRVRDHIAECASCRAELQELTALWTKLGVLEEEQPGPAVRTQFYSMLEKRIRNSRQHGPNLTERLGLWLNRWWPNQPVRQFGLSLTLLLAGLAIGNFFHLSGNSARESAMLRGEINNMRSILAVSLLEKPSASDRLRGINFSSEISKPDQSMLQILLKTLESDPNMNVRLAAVDALYLFRREPLVREGLIRSLSQQDSPMVQVALIELLSDIREQKAIDALKTLLQTQEIDPDVREKAEESIRRLEM